jgi:hypothetical protein
MRAAISCTTINAIVVGISVHRSTYPSFAPACEYVRMPPGSLSTLAVMKPGPNTARNASIRYFSTPRPATRRGMLKSLLNIFSFMA